MTRILYYKNSEELNYDIYIILLTMNSNYLI